MNLFCSVSEKYEMFMPTLPRYYRYGSNRLRTYYDDTYLSRVGGLQSKYNETWPPGCKEVLTFHNNPADLGHFLIFK